MSKNFNIHDWQDKHLREGMYGMEEREDYVVVDKRNLRPLKMIYGPNQYYEKYFTEKGAQDAANDLNRAYQKTYGAAEGPHVVMYKSDYFAEKRKQGKMDEHHAGDYKPGFLKQTVSTFLDKLKKKNEADYNKVEKIMEKHFSAKKANEASTTGTGASFQAGSGEGYATPKAFGDNKRKKRKAYMGYKEV